MTAEQYRDRILALIDDYAMERESDASERLVNAARTALEAALEPLLRDHAAWEAIRRREVIHLYNGPSHIATWTAADRLARSKQRPDPADAVLAAAEASRE